MNTKPLHLTKSTRQLSAFNHPKVIGGNNVAFVKTLIGKSQILALALMILIILLSGTVAMAVTYYSQGSTNPNTTSNWNTNRLGGGSSPSNFITAGNTFIIQGTGNGGTSPHTMTTTATWTVSGTGSSVQVETGGTLVASYAVSAPSWTFASGATYQHAQNGGAIPTATWNAGSTLYVTGITTTVCTGLGQAFANITWNCTGQTTAYGGNFVTTGISISGDVTVTSTGSTDIGFNNVTGTSSLTIGGKLIINGGTYRVSYRNSPVLAVTGDITISSGTLQLNSSDQAGTYTGTINANGNISISGGTLDLSKGSASTHTGTLNVTGNFSHTAGTVTETGSATGNAINFTGTYNGTTGMQTYTSGGTVSNTVNFTVNNGAYLQMAAAGTTITGGGTFTLATGGTLGVTSPNGIVALGTASGNIQTTTARTFSTGANYIYNGTAAQNTGTGLPATVSNLTFNNIGGAVTFTSTCNVTNNFSVTAGSIANLGTFTHSAGSLTLGGAAKPAGTWGSSISAATYKNNSYFASTTGMLNVATGIALPTAVFSGLTASQILCPGTATVTLSGVVSAGTVYPADGETVGVTINGITQNAIVAGGVGGFSMIYNSSVLPASATAYPITYSYAGGIYLSAATNNSSTSILVNVPSASVSTQANVSCFGGNNGSITIHASGGIAPYSYSVDNGTTWTSSGTDPYTYGGLVANTQYKIRVKDNNSCISPAIP